METVTMPYLITWKVAGKEQQYITSLDLEINREWKANDILGAIGSEIKKRYSSWASANDAVFIQSVNILR